MVPAVFVRENAPDSAGRTGDEQQLEQEYYAHLASFVNKIFYDDACGDGAVRTLSNGCGPRPRVYASVSC